MLNGQSIQQALADSLPSAGEKLAPLVEEALQFPALDGAAAAKRFGNACHVPEGLPVIAHIANRAPDYRTAIEENIRTGGDSCGRSIMLGAIMAAHTARQNGGNSIPLEWLGRLLNLKVATDACAQLPSQ